MNNKNKVSQNTVFYGVVFIIIISLCAFMHESVFDFLVSTAVYSAKSFLPVYTTAEKFAESKVTTQKETSTAESATESTAESSTSKNSQENKPDDFSKTPDDILSLMKKAEKTANKDKKGGTITEKTYTTDGATDTFSLVRVKNTNKTQIDIEKILGEKIDLSVNQNEPSVLIFHSHTTETYQILDRDFYSVSSLTRSNDSAVNMIRVGKEIKAEIEKMGFKVLHDTKIHDATYSTAYSHSKKSVEEYLKKYPSIQVVLDIHRDAIHPSSTEKIKPVTEIQGKKAAQIMIISGCQEDGNPIENFPDWKYNLTFAVHLQEKLEELFPSITRPLYFSPRKYNMNLTHCSLLVEIGSDANTLQEAVFTGKCLGKAVGEILEDYKEK